MAPSEGASRAVAEADGTAGAGASSTVLAGLFAGGMLGALLLLVAEFTTLFHVHVDATGAPVKSVGTGSHHSYALALVAVCAIPLAFAVWRSASRPALLALGVLGAAALVIALLGDLPDAGASGLVRNGGHYVQAGSTPSAGFYMETLGAVVLIFTSVWGFLLIGARGPRGDGARGPRGDGARGPRGDGARGPQAGSRSAL